MSTDIEAGVCEIVGRVLGRADCTTHSDFFELGGTSLGAMQVLWLIEERFGTKVSLTDFFDAPDLEAVADLVKQRR